MEEKRAGNVFEIASALCVAAFASSQPLQAAPTGTPEATTGAAATGDHVAKGGLPPFCDERRETRRRGSGMGQ